MTRRHVFSDSPYEDLIGYSRAVIQDGWVFVSGCTGADPGSGKFPEDVTAQCAHVLSRIDAVLSEAGAGFADVVRVTYVLSDRLEFESCWPQLRAAFGEARPAAMMIEAGLLDPAMKIEIEVTARLPDTG